MACSLARMLVSALRGILLTGCSLMSEWLHTGMCAATFADFSLSYQSLDYFIE
jgi:hypothetical protein